MKKAFIISCITGLLISWSTGLASAHVVVKPSSVTAQSYQTFSVGVPVESDLPVVSVRLLVPDGVTDVTPNVKPGWTITVKRDRITPSVITGILWSGGSIPQGMRDEFSFSAKTPTMATTLAWKAYVTDKNGNVAAWDATPSADKSMSMDDDMGKGGPYSITAVTPKVTAVSAKQPNPTSNRDTLTMIIAIVSLILSLIALGVSLPASRKR